MKVNFSQPMTDMDGEQVPERDANQKPTGKVWTLARVSVAALLHPERDLEANEAIRRFDLALKLRAGGLLDVSLDDVNLIKAQTLKAFPPLFYGFVHYAFERAALGEKLEGAQMRGNGIAAEQRAEAEK